MGNSSKEPIREILGWVNPPNPHRLDVSLHYSKPYLSSLGSLKPLIYVEFVAFVGNLFPNGWLFDGAFVGKRANGIDV